MLRAELLAEPHLDSRRSACLGGLLAQLPQTCQQHPRSFIQRSAVRASPQMLARCSELWSTSFQVVIEPRRGKFFTIHLYFSKNLQRLALARFGASRSISSFASSNARPRCSRERTVPIGHSSTCAASS